jgi:predicted nucleic acid-binding protein
MAAAGRGGEFSNSVEEASELFVAAGAPRSPRTIIRYCARDHLDCIKVDTEQNEKYLISRELIDRRIEEIQQIARSSRVSNQRDVSRPDSPSRDTDALPAEETPRLQQKITTLESEIVDLKIANRARGQYTPSSAASRPPVLPRRARSDRRLRPRVVRGPRAALHATGLRGRRDEPLDGTSLHRLGVGLPLLASTRSYLEQHGKPVAFYSDRASIFRVVDARGKQARGDTQFGRALSELNIDSVCANTPQAKGRVERAHLTLQDRLVKELRLRRVSTPEAGNVYLPEFVRDYNERFSREPHSAHDAHRPVRDDEDLEQIFLWQEDRKLSKDLTVHYERVLYIVEATPETIPLAGKHCRIDPADRFIVATALEHSAPIVTPDERIRAYPHVQSAW